MSFAVYDNPATMTREAWRDGKCVGGTSLRLLLDKNFRGWSRWPLYFNCGPWADGKIRGDSSAIQVTG